MAADSKGAVLLALCGNSFLTAIKFGAFVVSGSGAMLSEAVHSLADTGNQALLWLGIRRSQRRPDAMFPYGYGAERYFFALLSAVGIFVLGCGVTVYHGCTSLFDPPELHLGFVTWTVLAIALVVDGAVLVKVVRSLRGVVAGKGLRTWLRESTDPTVPAVLFEDAVACLGVLVAALGIGLSSWTGSHVPDAVGSILIGCMLGTVAIWLAVMNRGLILGRAVPRPLEEDVRAFLVAQESVQAVHDLRSRVLGAEDFRIKADLDFDGAPIGRKLAPWVAERLAELGDDEVSAFAGEFGERVVNALGDEVDRIEAAMRERFPRMRFVDLEAD